MPLKCPPGRPCPLGPPTPTRPTLFLALALAVVLGGCSGAPSDPLDAVAQRSLARLDGEISLPGLQEPVEVLRDRWGIPHIYAQNTQDLFFAQGYITAQDRLWQMEMWRRWREGRLAEIFGPEALPFDRRTRLMMFRGPWDDREWTAYHPEGERIFTAFAEGVNAFIEDNRDNLPLEFQITGVAPEPWTAQTVVLRWAQAGLASVRGHALEEIQLALAVKRFGVQEANRRAAPDPWDDLQIPEGLNLDAITQEVLDAARAGDGDPFAGALPPLEILEPFRSAIEPLQVARVSPWDPRDAGSNNWVLSGRMSVTGLPILANDPHRRIEMPALRYMVGLHAPGWDLIGGGEPPFVGVDAGHNGSMAWGFTFAGTDMVDVFVDELHPEDPTRVRWKEGWEPLTVIREEIPVKGGPPEIVDLHFSRHGPIFHLDLENGLAYAVRSANQEFGTAPYLGSFRLAQAEGCQDFFARAMAWKVPTHSLICGDIHGDIALQVSGLTPNRNGWTGRLPVPGSGRFEWDGFREDLPREYNPERGYIATANDNVHPPDYRGRPVFYHSSIGVETSRIARIHQIFGGGGVFSVEDHKRIHHDNFSIQADRDRALFLGWTSEDADVERARSLLAGWDASLDRDSTPAALYVRWTEALESTEVRSASMEPMARQRAVEGALLRAVARMTADWGPDMSTWRHGRIHTSELAHMLVSRFDLPAVERGGAFGALNAAGANFRRIIDLSNLDNSVWTNAPGQSAQPGSPFYGNLREALGNGEYHPLAFSRSRVEEHTAHRLRLTPR